VSFGTAQGTLRHECLDHMLILRAASPQGLGRVRPALQRPPSTPGLQREPPQRQPSQATDISARIERRQVLGGLNGEYGRAA
jgi:hypothetical protein